VNERTTPTEIIYQAALVADESGRIVKDRFGDRVGEVATPVVQPPVEWSPYRSAS
jgi:hypothetical protein